MLLYRNPATIVVLAILAPMLGTDNPSEAQERKTGQVRSEEVLCARSYFKLTGWTVPVQKGGQVSFIFLSRHTRVLRSSICVHKIGYEWCQVLQNPIVRADLNFDSNEQAAQAVKLSLIHI